MPSKNMEFYEDAPLPDPEIQDLMNTEIESAPKAPGELQERLREHHSASPADSLTSFITSGAE